MVLPASNIPQSDNDNVIVSGLPDSSSLSSLPNVPSQPTVPSKHVHQPSTHGMVTRSKSRSYANELFASTAYVSEPTNVYIALQYPEWRVAIQKEIEALHEKNTWTLTSMPPLRSPVGYKWIFKKGSG